MARRKRVNVEGEKRTDWCNRAMREILVLKHKFI